jgi:polar amino acid transport system substrate-binding protein
MLSLFPARLKIMVIVCLTLLTLHPAYAQKRVIVSSANYPPFTYVIKVPPYGFGLGCDIVEEAFRSVSLTTEFYLMPMTRNVWSMTERRSAANLGVFRWYEAKGVSNLVQSIDILEMNFVLFYKKQRFPDGIPFTRLSDLVSYRITTVRGSFMMQAYKDAGLNVSYSTGVKQNILKLEADRVDLAIAADIAGWQIIKEHFPDKMEAFATVKRPVMSEPLSMIFRKEDHQLQAAFTRGLKNIVANGRYEEILRKYYQRAGRHPEDLSVYIPQYLQLLMVNPVGTSDSADGLARPVQD